MQLLQAISPFLTTFPQLCIYPKCVKMWHCVANGLMLESSNFSFFCNVLYSVKDKSNFETVDCKYLLPVNFNKTKIFCAVKSLTIYNIMAIIAVEQDCQHQGHFGLNPFPHNDTFWCVWERSLLKTLCEKEKLIIYNIMAIIAVEQDC